MSNQDEHKQRLEQARADRQQRHFERVQATILSGLLANPNLMPSPQHIDERAPQLITHARALAQAITLQALK